ncbi:hypothetical protein A3A50_04105 [Candidatus Woesebacteria bacterium RIFCSPLOWO2_01_FULL_38_20]|nr:MAG: hypothetical protein A3A50_04105 [Candidatus Woesebacteria bacterium RIFCSPLOWO2_01_FULL_38_20]
MKYYSTFITGLQEVVGKALKGYFDDIKIVLMLDGLVVYETNRSIKQIKDLRFLNNSFITFHVSKKGDKYSPPQLINKVIQQSVSIANLPSNALQDLFSFRVIASSENQLVSIDKKLLKDIENLLSKKLKLKIDRSNPDTEVWFLARREGYSFIGLRITKTPNYEKTLHQGELRPELANIMCLLAELKPQDVILDPFAGYGAIPLECAKSFEVNKIIAGENNKKVFKILQEKIKIVKQGMVVGRWNALNLSSLTDKSVDKIITDPPWGIYNNKTQDLTSFYKQMLIEFNRLVKSNGLTVILTAQKDMLENLMKDFPAFKLLERYDVLVSGKKASIYKIKVLENK